MKKMLLLFILIYVHHIHAAGLYDRIKTQDLWLQTASSLSTGLEFNEEFKKSSVKKRERILSLGSHLQYIFPQRILESYLTWRILRPDDKKAVNVLKYALSYRLLLLRDVIDSPLSTKQQIKKARELLSELTQIPEISSENIWSLTHELIDHKAKILHAIEDDQVLALALKETPWLGLQFHIPDMPRYVINPLGYLKGNAQSWVSSKSVPSAFQKKLSSLKRRLIIESKVMDQFPEILSSLQKHILQNNKSPSEYHIIFHTPQDKEALIKWEQFRDAKGISISKLNFIIRPQAWDDSVTSTAPPEVEAAPLFPRELDPTFSQGGLISFDPTTQHPKTLLTGPLSIPKSSVLSLVGPAAAAFVLASEILPSQDWVTEIKGLNQDVEKNQTVRPAKLSSRLKLQEVRPLLIDMISKANKNIFIDQFFLFDAHIVQSLIKRKIQRPQLDVRLLMDHNSHYSMGGFPNTLFLADMIKYGLKIKSRKESKSNSSLILVDNEVALIGPQNLIPTQLSFESSLQVAQVFGQDFLSPRIEEFEADWQETSNLYEFNIKDFRFMTPTQILNKDDSKLLNAIGAEFLRQKD